MSRAKINLRVCRRCPDCQAQPKNGGCKGPCKCLVNGRDIHELAAENFCPAGRYKRRLIGDWIAWLARITRAKWLHYQARRLVAFVGKRLGLVPPEFKVPYHCRTCPLTQAWINRQQLKWSSRRKRRRHARVLREALNKRRRIMRCYLMSAR